MKYLFPILTFLFISCKQKGIDKPLKDEKSTVEEVSKDEPNQIEVVITAVVPLDDVFELFFYEPGEDGFHPKDFVEEKVTGNENVQNIKFVLPESIYPERMRFDFGKNKNQEQMKLEGIKLIFKDKQYSFTAEELKSLRPSKFMVYDNEKMTLDTESIENKYDPYFYSMKLTGIVDYLLEEE